MTLILSTICENGHGLCICADKRSKWPNGTTKDNFYKLYSFKNLPLIIYNHGVNRFGDETWDHYCSEYEGLNSWKDHHNLNDITEDFRKFIENNIREELKKNFDNKLSEYTKSFFDFCGSTRRDKMFRIFELFWSFQDGMLKLERPKFGNLVCSGDGKRYLDNYFQRNLRIYTNEYWADLNIIQAKEELKNLFLVAAEEKNRLGGEEFSDDFDIECIPND